MGWEVDASGLTELLVRVKGDYTELPIYITENGAAFDDYVDPNGHILDHDRVSYLEEHISAVHDAIEADVNVQGYFVWSLLDNFEWTRGYGEHFGLVHVDLDTFKRTAKPSAQHLGATLGAAVLVFLLMRLIPGDICVVRLASVGLKSRLDLAVAGRIVATAPLVPKSWTNPNATSAIVAPSATAIDSA